MKSMFLKVVLTSLCVIILLPSCDLFRSGSDPISQTVTPSSYKIAVINMELQDTDGGSVNIINNSAEDPQILDISSSRARPRNILTDFLNQAVLEAGKTYDSYILTPLYIEMDLTGAFHVPDSAAEDGYSLIFETDGDEETYTFRFYFNPVDNYWRRDIVVYLSGILNETGNPDTDYPDGWYWMRRVIEPGADDFFILAQAEGVDYSSNPLPDHPASDIGPTSVIDLFDNEDFWGDPEAYDDSSVETVIDSSDDVGGMNAVWHAFTYSEGDTLTNVGDVEDTFNFWYEDNPDYIYTDLASDADVVDLGPDYDNPAVPGDEEKYGDWGFHPFMPEFTTTVTAGS